MCRCISLFILMVQRISKQLFAFVLHGQQISIFVSILQLRLVWAMLFLSLNRNLKNLSHKSYFAAHLFLLFIFFFLRGAEVWELSIEIQKNWKCNTGKYVCTEMIYDHYYVFSILDYSSFKCNLYAFLFMIIVLLF